MAKWDSLHCLGFYCDHECYQHVLAEWLHSFQVSLLLHLGVFYIELNSVPCGITIAMGIWQVNCRIIVTLGFQGVVSSASCLFIPVE